MTKVQIENKYLSPVKSYAFVWLWKASCNKSVRGSTIIQIVTYASRPLLFIQYISNKMISSIIKLVQSWYLGFSLYSKASILLQ